MPYLKIFQQHSVFVECQMDEEHTLLCQRICVLQNFTDECLTFANTPFLNKDVTKFKVL